MPNYCSYTMRVRGTKEAIDEMERRLTDYDNSPHFWRVFGADRTDDLGSPDADGRVCATFCGDCVADVSPIEAARVCATFCGDCAWSVYSCMRNGHGTYAGEFAKEQPDKVTSLEETAGELGLDIEVYATEPGMGFAEHYLFDADGKVVIDDSADYEELWWDRDEFPTFEDLDAEFDLTGQGISEDDFIDGEWLSIGGFEESWSI